MLNLRETRITLNRHANVLPGVVIPEEGTALVYVKKDGETFVQPSTGAAGELFAGISMERNLPPRSMPFISEYELTDTGVLQLPRTPIAGQIAVIEGTDVRTVTIGDEHPTGANAVLDGDQLLFDTASAEGRVVRVQMLYVPDMEEARTYVGDAPFGGQASAITGVIGRILDGEVATTCVDVSKDWTNALRVVLGADGRFAPHSGSAVPVPQVVVKNSPNASNPFLILSINVA